jgi:hypothetical protein
MLLRDTDLAVGLVVRHETRVDWGLGRIIQLDDRYVQVYFKDIEGGPDDALRKLSRASHHLERAEIQNHGLLDHLQTLTKSPRPARAQVRLTEQQAVDQFIDRYGSFENGAYLRHERDYKWKAHLLIAEWLSADEGKRMLSSGASEKVSDVMRTLMAAANLLTAQETLTLNEAMQDAAAASRYAAALVAFIETPSEPAFKQVASVVAGMLADPARTNALAWPAVTLLPYLARPTDCMFLKPQLTRRIADAFCFDLLYEARPSWATYARLLRLSEHLLDRLRPLGARDFIDVQSFMWTVAGKT